MGRGARAQRRIRRSKINKSFIAALKHIFYYWLAYVSKKLLGRRLINTDSPRQAKGTTPNRPYNHKDY